MSQRISIDIVCKGYDIRLRGFAKVNNRMDVCFCFLLPIGFQVNVMGLEKEKIQQSYSFKRLMADVLGETDF